MKRKTQIERSEETQAKIIQSAIHLLEQKGSRAANLQEISKGAGVTLGALQHHFPNRLILMERLIDEVMEPLFSENSMIWPSTKLCLEERVKHFIHNSWEIVFGKPSYLAAWSLFMGCKADEKLFLKISENRSITDPIFCNMLIRSFPELKSQKNDADILASIIFSTLRGMGIYQIFSISNDEIKSQLNALEMVFIKICQAS